MAHKTKNITQATNVPKGSLERHMAPLYERKSLLKNSGLLVLGISELRKGYVIGRQACPFHVLLICIDGGGDVWEGDVVQHFGAGDLVFIPSGTQYYRSDHDFTMLWVHLDPQHPRYSHLLKKCARVWPGSKAVLRPMFEMFYQESRHIGLSDVPVIKALASLIASALDRELGEDESPRVLRIRRSLEGLWAEVSQNLATPWSVEMLAARLHVSPTHFHGLCHEHHGQTPMAMVTSLRMEQARLLLSHSEEKLHGIAKMVGYTSPFSLSRSIKRHFGLSPRELRKRG